jgi:hypothetical protein
MKQNGKVSSQNRGMLSHSLGLRTSWLSSLVFCGLALSGCEKQKPSSVSTDTLASAPTAPAMAIAQGPASAEPNSFDEVAAQLDRGGSFYVYASTEKWLAELSTHFGTMREGLLLSMPMGIPGSTLKPNSDAESKSMGALFKLGSNLYNRSGVGDVTGVGASSFALEPGLYRNKLFIHHNRGKGSGPFWSAFGKAPHALTALDLLPADTALAGFGDFDPAEIVTFLRREVEQSDIPEAKKGLEQAIKEFPAMAGMTFDEAIGSLGTSVGFLLTLDATKPLEISLPEQKFSIPTPRMAFLLQVKDDRIFKRIDQLVAANPGLTKVDEADLRLRTLPTPSLPVPIELRPTVAQWGGYLILATDDKLIRDIIAAKTSGKGLKSSAAFAKMAEGLPTEGNGFQLATAALGETIARAQRELVRGQTGTTPEQRALIEKLLGNQKPMGATYSVSAHLPNGWLIVNKGNQGASQLLAPTVILPAIAAGVALPVFSEVGNRSKATKSLSQAKQIGTACKIYAVDYSGKYPKKLADLVPDYLPDVSIFVSPFAPSEPMGYTYHPGLTDESPGTEVLLEDKFADREKQRVVIYADGRGEVLKVGLTK